MLPYFRELLANLNRLLFNKILKSLQWFNTPRPYQVMFKISVFQFPTSSFKEYCYLFNLKLKLGLLILMMRFIKLMYIHHHKIMLFLLTPRNLAPCLWSMRMRNFRIIVINKILYHSVTKPLPLILMVNLLVKLCSRVWNLIFHSSSGYKIDMW